MRFASLCLLVCLVTGASPATGEQREIVLLSTNDFHSAIDPILAYWLSDEPKRQLGGASHLMTMVEEIRAREARNAIPTFLFDSGDLFTGKVAKLTRGEALMEMLTTLRYDALGIGNHEFDYGWQNFRRQMFRVSYPVLGANIFYRGATTRDGQPIPFSAPHAIVEHNGVRLGVIGIIGLDARSVILPSFVEQLDFTDPAEAVQRSIDEIRDDVDLIVVLAHQGKTGPMQTDAENRPEVQRDFDTDIELCGAVPEIDVLLGGHAHRGIEVPYVHPETGCIITQTYGFGTRLGFLRLVIDTEKRQVVSHQGELLKVWSDEHEPHPVMKAKMDAYRREVATIADRVVGHLAAPLSRVYNGESAMGNFTTDVLRQRTGADIAVTNAGGLRADLDRGPVTAGDVHDALPFFNTVVTVEMTGAQVAAILEQGLTLERGMLQVSGLTLRFDPEAPPGKRLVDAKIGGEPLDRARSYTVATNSFVAEGGDLYSTFLEARWVANEDEDIADAVIEAFEKQKGVVEPPVVGNRLLEAVKSTASSEQ
jgi:2',3'-cyclic-nucleotide 2'-phosphodiesterase (5'-nucleotidase family)